MDTELLRLINAVTAHIKVKEGRNKAKTTCITMEYNGAMHVQIIPRDHKTHEGLLSDIAELKRYVELKERIEKKAR